jgi:hypothetical protein
MRMPGFIFWTRGHVRDSLSAFENISLQFNEEAGFRIEI